MIDFKLPSINIGLFALGNLLGEKSKVYNPKGGYAWVPSEVKWETTKNNTTPRKITRHHLISYGKVYARGASAGARARRQIAAGQLKVENGYYPHEINKENPVPPSAWRK